MVVGVWCGVGVEEGVVEVVGDQFLQSLLMNIVFKYWQIVQVRVNVVYQYMVVVEYQMLWGDGSSQQFVIVMYVFGGVFGGDMFKNYFQVGQVLVQGFYYCFNKVCFVIENINFGVSDFVVNE